ncbi:MAG: purine-binding chemotaxis protein CheW [Gemmatimonadales bacterium]|nr:purine-binding chemotaxis protein CheW [Gemmatimonadales bacterium]
MSGGGLGRELHLLTFALDREAYGVPVGQVREVIRVTEITRVPHAPAHVRGVTNLRGRILPVVEIRTRLGLEPGAVTGRSRIVVVEVHDRVLGILVDAVLQVTKIPLESVTPPPAEVVSPGSDWISGVAQSSSRLVFLLELEKALQAPE